MTSAGKTKMMVAGIMLMAALFGLVGGVAYVNADGHKKSISNEDIIQYQDARKHHGKLVDVEAIKSKIQEALDGGEITQEEAEAKLESLYKGKDFPGKYLEKPQ